MSNDKINIMSRGKNKIQNPYTIREIYNDYIKDKKEYSPYYVDYKTYKSIILDYISEMVNYMLYEAGTFKMPYRLGNLRVIKQLSSIGRNNRKSVDFNLTKKYGKTIYHYNEHSDGYKFMFKWDKKKAVVKHKTFYRFIPSRHNKRHLAYIIKNNKADFFEN